MMIIPTGTPPDRFRLDTLRALQATAALREALESRERWLAGAHASTLHDLRALAESLQRDLDNEVDPGLSPDAENLLREGQQLQAVVPEGRYRTIAARIESLTGAWRPWEEAQDA